MPCPPAKRKQSRTTTRRAGRFRPAASVGVEAMHLIAPARNPSSTSPRYSRLRPAWWNAAPRATQAASVRSTSVVARSVIRRAYSARAGSFDLIAVAGPLREPLGVPPRVDEDQALAALVDRVEAEVQVVGLRGRRVELAAAVVEPDLPAVVDPLPEADRPPVGGDERGVEPVRERPRVPDGGREPDQLERRIEPAELRDHDLEGRAAVGRSDQVDLVHDEQGHLGQPGRPVPEERVDLLRGRDHDLVAAQVVVAPVEVTGRDPDPGALGENSAYFSAASARRGTM